MSKWVQRSIAALLLIGLLAGFIVSFIWKFGIIPFVIGVIFMASLTWASVVLGNWIYEWTSK